MQRKFASLLTLACQKLKTVSIVDLRVFITQLCADQKENIPLFDEHMSEIINHSTLEELFIFLSRIGAWDFLNFHILACIAQEYDEDKKLVDKVRKYESEVNEFKKQTKLRDFLRVWPGRTHYKSLPGRVPLTTKRNIQWDEYTLANLAEDEEYLASQFRLHQFIFHFSNAEPGSVTLMWLIPASAAALIEKAIMEKEPDLKRMKIQELTVGIFTYKVPLTILH